MSDACRLGALVLAAVASCTLGLVGCRSGGSGEVDSGANAVDASMDEDSPRGRPAGLRGADSAAGSADATESGDAATSADGALHPPPGQLPLGILQFDVRHNMQTDACRASLSCFLRIENESDTPAWLSEIGAYANLAVLHWDRPIPWLAFEPPPPDGADPVAFYDARLDEGIRAWIDAFVPYFESKPLRYLAVTPLDGMRQGLAPARLDEAHHEVPVAPACGPLLPDTVVEFQRPDTGATESFVVGDAYLHFVRYLLAKLHPDFVAIAIEANLLRVHCPERWPELVALYGSVYDALRPDLDEHVRLFATLTLRELLAYDEDHCPGPLGFEQPCGSSPPPPRPQPDPLACFPLDRSAVDDLDEGGRLEILALSFYPDALLMDVTGEGATFRMARGLTDPAEQCDARARLRPFVDPFEALDRLEWHGPVAIAELGARSCPIWVHVQGDAGEDWTVQLPGSATSQAFWLSRALEAARSRHFAFYVQTFLRDYPPLGLWTVQQSVLDPDVWSIFNGFACMGLLTADGAPKGAVTETWTKALGTP